MVGGGSDFARFKSSIVGAQPPPCDQDGNNATIQFVCIMCSVLLSGSKECCSSCNVSCSVQSMHYVHCAVYALCAVCSLCIVCSGRCAAREKCATSYISGSNVLCHRLGRNNMLVRAIMCILVYTYSPYYFWYM